MNNLKETLEAQRDSAAMELGYLCYNHSIDNGNAAEYFLPYINKIKYCSFKIGTLRDDTVAVNGYEKLRDTTAINLGYVRYNLYVDNRLKDTEGGLCENIFKINKQLLKTDDNASAKPIKINCPSGMEQIPESPILCVCGYKNRNYAVYCGCCGKRLWRDS